MESKNKTVTSPQNVECETLKIETKQVNMNLTKFIVTCKEEKENKNQLSIEKQLQENKIITAKMITEETKSEESVVNEKLKEKKIRNENVEQECVSVKAGLKVKKINDLQETVVVVENHENIKKKGVVQDAELPKQKYMIKHIEELAELKFDLKQQEAEPQLNFVKELKSIEVKDVGKENVEEILTKEILGINRVQDANEEAFEDINKQMIEEVVIYKQENQLEENLEIEQNSNLIVTEQEDRLYKRIIKEQIHKFEECAEDEVQEICEGDHLNVEAKSKQIVVSETEEQQNEQNEISLPPFVINVLDAIAISEGFLPGYKYELLPGSNHGDGYVAIMVRVIISGKKNKNYRIIDDKRKLICKLPPTNEVRRKQFGCMQLFEREVFMYNVMLPYFLKFQLEKGIKPHEGFFSFAKCYYACYDEAKEESVVILEDLLERGFQVPDKFKPVSYVAIRKLMITLGRFHAISLALKEQKPEQFDKFKVKDTNEIITTDKHQPIFEMLCDEAMDTLEAHEEFKREKLEKLKPNISKVMMSCIQNDETEPYAVVNHGDCWINNIMFTEKLDICMIDWQVSRYCSPVLDLVYFIFTCTDAETRFQHYKNCIQIYHNALSTFLERLGGDVSRQFPLSALNNQLKKYGKFGICKSILITPMLCTKTSDMPVLDTVPKEAFNNIDKNDALMNMKDRDMYKIRMSSVIRDGICLGYL